MVIRRLAGRTVVTPLRITVVRVRDANEKTAPESRRTFRCDIKICQCPIEHRRVSGSTVARWFSAVGFRRSKPKRDHGVRHPRDDARRRAVAGPRPAPRRGVRVLTGRAFAQEFAGDGLRTLCCAVRDIDDGFFESWKHKYVDAAAARADREERLNGVYNEIETHLKLIGKCRSRGPTDADRADNSRTAIISHGSRNVRVGRLRDGALK